jgi:RNA polymerase sigma-70 factor (ECF subfamily)
VGTAGFESVIEQHYSRVLRTSLVLTGNAWEAEDLAQETFLEALRSWQRFAGRSEVSTWLHAILVNLHRKRLRTKQRRSGRWLTWLEKNRRSAVEPPERQLEYGEWQTSLWKLVAALPEGQRYAIVLRYAEEMNYQQIAEILNCPVGTVKSRLHHGLATLKKRCDPEPTSAGPSLPPHQLLWK